MWQDVFDRHFAPAKPVNQECLHEEIIEENERQVCVECGCLVGQKFITHAQFVPTGVVRRRATVSTIYEYIPADLVDDYIKNVAVTIYKIASVKRQYRASFRKTIIAACVHRASIVCGCPLAIYTCATAFNIKSIAEMEKGIAFVAENVPYGEYSIPTRLTSTQNFEPILTEFGIPMECILMKRIKLKLESEPFFHQRSSLCACVWFLLSDVYLNSDLSLRQYTSRYNSVCDKSGIVLKRTTPYTIRKRYMEIKRHVYRKILKRIFAKYLYKTFKCDEVQSDDGTIIVSNIKQNVRVVGYDGFVYPIDDVDDITDWNILFQQHWKGSIIPYTVHDTNKKIYIDGDLSDEMISREIKHFFRN